VAIKSLMNGAQQISIEPIYVYWLISRLFTYAKFLKSQALGPENELLLKFVSGAYFILPPAQIECEKKGKLGIEFFSGRLFC
jgi:hypothetical protein